MVASDRIRRLQGNDETRIGGGMDFGPARRPTRGPATVKGWSSQGAFLFLEYGNAVRTIAIVT
jgi:hypothetical protein